MRLRRLAAVVCAAGLSACAPQPEPVDAPIAVAGYQAYRDGDRAGLKAAIEALSARLPADPLDPALEACSAEGFALRRVARFRNELAFLDNTTVFAAGETGRFAYRYALQFQNAGRSYYWRGRGIEVVMGPIHNDYRDHPDHPETARLDRAELSAVKTASLRQMTDWENELRRRWPGAEFDRRMAAAVSTLHAARLSETDRWSPSH